MTELMKVPAGGVLGQHLDSSVCHTRWQSFWDAYETNVNPATSGVASGSTKTMQLYENLLLVARVLHERMYE